MSSWFIADLHLDASRSGVMRQLLALLGQIEGLSLIHIYAIWHLFVLAGAACHCVAIAVYVIPA